MRVAQLGAGRPDVAVVGAIHGDEPSGAAAIERLLADDPTVKKPVKLIVANEEALELDVRYVDTDLNRSFDDRVPADAHERKLADRLAEELRGTTVLSIHTTQSYPYPFAISSGVKEHVREFVPKLSVRALVDTGSPNEGRVFEADANIIEVEAGLQKSEAAAENAYRLLREFLTATGVLPGETTANEVPLFRIQSPIEKPEAAAYEVFAENFAMVAADEPFASADGVHISEPESFFPILLSANGYADIFGYRGEKVGTIPAGQVESGGASSTRSKSRSNAQ